jgi:hypothetical protein
MEHDRGNISADLRALPKIRSRYAKSGAQRVRIDSRATMYCKQLLGHFAASHPLLDFNINLGPTRVSISDHMALLI